MSANTVYVKNISSQTSEKEVKDFFSFCGKIANIEVIPAGETQNATVTFEKETAAKTALLLDNTQLGSTHVQVTSAAGVNEEDSSHYSTTAERDTDEITQEEKPKTRIIAEYLAHGYAIGDQAAQRAIDLDHKHGVSSKFLDTLNKFDQKYHATDKAKSLDQSYGVTEKTNSLFSRLNSFYEKAAGTPTGQKLANFYTQTSRQIQDIHAEARRLADLKKHEARVQKVAGTEKTTCKCGSDSANCPCGPGECACVGCAKSDVKEASGNKDKTTCKCGGDPAQCACPPGHCVCNSCPKAEVKSVASGSDKTTCNCGGNDRNCLCQEGKCACSGCSK